MSRVREIRNYSLVVTCIHSDFFGFAKLGEILVGTAKFMPEGPPTLEEIKKVLAVLVQEGSVAEKFDREGNPFYSAGDDFLDYNEDYYKDLGI